MMSGWWAKAFLLLPRTSVFFCFLMHAITLSSFLLPLDHSQGRRESPLVTTAAMAKVRLVENAERRELGREEGGREAGHRGGGRGRNEEMEANGTVLTACSRRCWRQRKAWEAILCVRAIVPGSFGRGAAGGGSFSLLPASIESYIIIKRPPLTPPYPFFLLIPSQSKNHTNRNQSFKAHRNGIKKPKNYVSKSLKGVSACMLACLSISISFGWVIFCAAPFLPLLSFACWLRSGGSPTPTHAVLLLLLTA